MFKGLLQAEKKGCKKKYENYERRNLIGKGKYTVKVLNQPHIKLWGGLQKE